MSLNVRQISQMLIEALDADCNIKDEAKVLEVLAALEVHPITKDELEETRLGRYINDMRRKTKQLGLAKRAKQLLRKWGQQVNTNSASASLGGISPGNFSPAVSRPGSAAPSPALRQYGVVSPAMARIKSGMVQSAALRTPVVSSPSLTPGHQRRKAVVTPKPPSIFDNEPNLRPAPSSPAVYARLAASKAAGNTPSGSSLKHSASTGTLKTYGRGTAISPALARVAVSGAFNSNNYKQAPGGVSANSASTGRHRSSLVSHSDVSKRIPPASPALSAPGSGTRPVSRSTTPLLTAASNRLGNGDRTVANQRSTTPGSFPRLPLNSRVSPVGTPMPVGKVKHRPGTLATATSGRPTTTVVNGIGLGSSAGTYRIRKRRLSEDNDSLASASSISKKSRGGLSNGGRPATPGGMGGGSGSVKSGGAPAGKAAAALRARTPKVKTTAQIIADLQLQQQRSGVKTGAGQGMVMSDTIRKIVTNQIHKEVDDAAESVVPVGARPRARRKPGSAGTPSAEKVKRGKGRGSSEHATSASMSTPVFSNKLSKTKKDFVHRFLDTSVHVENDEDMDIDVANISDELLQVDRICEAPAAINAQRLDGVDGTSAPADPAPRVRAPDDPYALLPPLRDPSFINWDSDPEEGRDVTRAPNGQYDIHSKDNDMSGASECSRLSEEDVDMSDDCGGISKADRNGASLGSRKKGQLDRLHESQWAGVNGSVDPEGGWHGWKETYSIYSDYHGADCPIVILPYSDING